MKQVELNAYLGILKSLARLNKLDTLKGIAARDGGLEATNLDVQVRVQLGNGGSGVYDARVLDLVKISGGTISADDISAYLIKGIWDWVEFPVWEEEAEVDLSAGVGEKILAALPYAEHKDNSRPALTGVGSLDGQITATDGYHAYITEKITEHDFLIPAKVLMIYKKVAKYGKWRLILGTEKTAEGRKFAALTNGIITITTPQISFPLPDIRTLVDGAKEYTHTIKIPLLAVKQMTDRHSEELRIDEEGNITIDRLPAPFKAEVREEEFIFAPGQEREVICARINAGFCSLNPGLLADISKVSKEGEVILRVGASNIYSVA